MRTLRIGTRGSQLALWQAEFIQGELQRHHCDLKCEIVVVKTTGDKILDVPLAKIGGKGLFTKELEQAMEADEVDLAVHSLKDVPVVFPEGFELSAVTERDDPRDCWLSEKYENLDAIPQNGVVGTTSLRRGMQIVKYRPDLSYVSLRGNVQTRIRKLKEGEFDAIILATAGINRLNIWGETRYMGPIDEDLMIPAMGQAALGIETQDGSEASQLVKVLNHAPSFTETALERAFVRKLEGGCQVPIGVRAKIDGESISARCIVGLPDASEMVEDSISGSAGDAVQLGEKMAERMIGRGAQELLKRAESMAFKE